MGALSQMSDVAFAEMLAAKRKSVDDVAADIIARLHEPQGFTSRRRWEVIALLLVTVPGRETPFAIRASTDGDDAKAVSIPKSQIAICHSECEGLFIVATMKAWVAIDRHMAQATMPQLTKSASWTPEQRAGWKTLQQRLRAARDAIQATSNKRLPSDSRRPLLNRGEVA
jgi:hypothetical protein